MPQQRSSDASLPGIAADLWELVKTYVKQETVGPLKGLARSVGLGIAGSLVLGIGVLLLTLSALRALQTETGSTFTGNLSWIPYLLTVVLVVIVIAVALGATRKRTPNGAGKGRG